MVTRCQRQIILDLVIKSFQNYIEFSKKTGVVEYDVPKPIASHFTQAAI